ncbi:MAG: hypothetical protein WD688_23030 [Candidatus Binatia bacterium]
MTSRPNLGVGIFGYGSLLSDPGDDIGLHVVEHMPHISPWKIEYARRSDGRGGGPTLVIHQAGGAVNGQVLVLDGGANRLAEVGEWLWQRENRPKRRCIKEMRLAGLDHVLYCDIESNIRDTDMNAESLARFAIESVSSKPERNGIAYLARNIEMGVITPLTHAYQDAILRLTG